VRSVFAGGSQEYNRREPTTPGATRCLATLELAYHPDRLRNPLKRTCPKGDPDPGEQRTICVSPSTSAIADSIHWIQRQSLDPRVVCGPHGWWQACPQIGAPGHDPFSADGANLSLIIGGRPDLRLYPTPFLSLSDSRRRRQSDTLKGRCPD